MTHTDPGENIFPKLFDVWESKNSWHSPHVPATRDSLSWAVWGREWRYHRSQCPLHQHCHPSHLDHPQCHHDTGHDLRHPDIITSKIFMTDKQNFMSKFKIARTSLNLTLCRRAIIPALRFLSQPSKSSLCKFSVRNLVSKDPHPSWDLKPRKVCWSVSSYKLFIQPSEESPIKTQATSMSATGSTSRLRNPCEYFPRRLPEILACLQSLIVQICCDHIWSVFSCV